jgi:hypothetical protein
VFLVLDLLLIFGLLKTSNAVYYSTANGEAPMDVALYAINYDGLYDVSSGSNETALDINLGDIEPGAVKKYKFKITNEVINDAGLTVKSDTNISYKIKIIVTTNIDLKYSLYYNQDPDTTGATNLFRTGGVDNGVYATDSWGTIFKHYTVDAKCLLKDNFVEDEYILKVEFPADYLDYHYQDLVESIKIQVESRQVLPGDPEEVLCH